MPPPFCPDKFRATSQVWKKNMDRAERQKLFFRNFNRGTSKKVPNDVQKIVLKYESRGTYDNVHSTGSKSDFYTLKMAIFMGGPKF